MSENTTIESKESYLVPGGIPIEEAKAMYHLLDQTVEATSNTISQYKFYSEVENSGQRQTISSGVTEKELLQLPELLETRALLVALRDYIEYAIKVYESLKRKLRGFTLENYCRLKGIEMPKKPSRGHVLTEDEYYGTLSVEETCRLLTLQARAATIGQLIHPQGHLSAEREKVMECSISPITVSGTGKDTIITETTPGIDIEEMDKMFYHLQDLHRDAQKRVNTFKFKCQQAIDASVNQAEKDFSQAEKQYDEASSALYAEYLTYTRKQDSRLRSLGVYIPKRLRPTFNRFLETGK